MTADRLLFAALPRALTLPADWQSLPWLLAPVALVLASWTLARALSGNARQFRLLARSLLLSAWILLLALGLASSTEVDVPTPGDVLALLDNSCSMHLPASTAGATTRYAAARAALLARVQALNESAVPLRPSWLQPDGPLAGEPPLAPTGCSPTTEVLATLCEQAASAGRPIVGAIVAGDGAERGDGQWRDEDERRARALPFAVHTIAVGQALPDVAIEAIHHSAFGFIKTTVPIEVVVTSEQLGRRAVDVRLWQGERCVAERRVLLAEREVVHFDLRLAEVGRQVFVATASVQPEEQVRDNNERAFSVQVLRDRTRVLHVLGRPSVDGRFVREALRESSNVDLVSFYILREPTSLAAVSERELSLIPFPVDRLFTSELANFDAVVLQNFDPRPFHMQRYASHLAEAVRGGLGLVLVGGPGAPTGAGWRETALAEVLPAALLESSEGEVHAYAAAPGATGHPLLAGLDLGGPGSGEALTPRPGAPGPSLRVDALGPLLPGGLVALEARALEAAGGPARPLLLAREVGRGRSILLPTGDTWQLQFTPVAAARAPLRQLWRNILRYVTEDGEGAPLELLLPSEPPTRGEPLALTARLRGKDHRPQPGAPVRLQARWLPSALGAAGEPNPEPPPAQVVSTNAAGLAAFSLPLSAAGRLVLAAEAHTAGSLARADATLAVLPGAEVSRVAPRPAWLGQLAAATGGTASRPADGAVAPEASWGQATRRLPLRTPLWPRPAVVGATLAVLLAHFAWARRRLANGGEPAQQGPHAEL